MARYLVEELYGSDLGGDVIRRRFTVSADSPQDAMWKAGGGTLPVPQTRPAPDEVEYPELYEQWELEIDFVFRDYMFSFGPNDLVEVDEGYRWQAANGSMVAFEVRNLDGAIEVDTLEADRSDIGRR